MLTIDQIEDAVVEELTDELGYLKTCKPLAEYLRDEVEDLTVRCPAAYVVYLGGTFENLPGNAQDRTMNFLVIVMAQNLRGDEAARHGQGFERGVYEMLEDVRSTLSDETCGLNISGLLPQDEEAIDIGTQNLAVYGIRFETRCENE